MVENPTSFTILFNLLTCNLPNHLPFSDQFLQQPILEDVMLTVNVHRGMISRHAQSYLVIDYICVIFFTALEGSFLVG